MSSYSPHSIRAIHYVPLGPPRTIVGLDLTAVPGEEFNISFTIIDACSRYNDVQKRWVLATSPRNGLHACLRPDS